MGAVGALPLLLLACGSEVPFQESQSAAVPPELRTAYLETARARFPLIACRGPEQILAIGGLDSARARAEGEIARNYAGVDMAALKQEADRESMIAQIERCAGEGGIARYRAAVSRLQQLAADAA